MSSTWRELAAIVFALESFGQFWKVYLSSGSLIKTAARIIEVGKHEVGFAQACY